MKDTLKDISVIAIEEKVPGLTVEHVKSTWLGNAPASDDEIKNAEERLGVELPKDYKDFLKITNGFFTPCDSTEPTFEKVNDIDHLKNVDPFLLEIWNEEPLIDIGIQLNRAIVVGGINDEQYFLLISPDNTNQDWQYWKFASWIPGGEPYGDLKAYFESVLDFMKDRS